MQWIKLFFLVASTSFCGYILILIGVVWICRTLDFFVEEEE